ncbi:MAG TPA: hypothetical protein PLO62_09060 [Candidatus Hydrogenedentes bacterium]|nr:hypothetical protein [Candidatus Hydrogenedentota bacterium]HOS03469.1 hypothetical protein [Candidatus Hydrogenedentota bacterium]
MTEKRTLTLIIRLMGFWFMLKPFEMLVLFLPIRPVPGAPLRVPDLSDAQAFLLMGMPCLAIAALVVWKAPHIARLLGATDNEGIAVKDAAPSEWYELIVRIAGLTLLAIGLPHAIASLAAIAVTLTIGSEKGIADFIASAPFQSSISSILASIAGVVLIVRSRALTHWLTASRG